MRRCTFLSLFSSPRARDDGAAEERDAVDEKRGRTPRDWPAIVVGMLRLLQLAYFVFAYESLHGFQRSSYFHEDGPWQPSPGEVRHARRMMRWVRMQASVVLVYHAFALAVPCLLRLVRKARRPFGGLATVFGDGCAVMAMLNIMVQLDAAHEGYCHSPPSKDDSITHAMLSFGREGLAPHHMSKHRSVCRHLDVFFGLGGLVILSSVLAAAITTWRARRSSPTVHAKVEQVSDVEQGSVQHTAAPVDGVHSGSTTAPERGHSPPPPYHHTFGPELAQDHLDHVADEAVAGHDRRSRASMETVSSLGVAHYLVSDGWRAPEEPPEYSSRPPSLHNAVPY